MKYDVEEFDRIYWYELEKEVRRLNWHKFALIPHNKYLKDPETGDYKYMTVELSPEAIVSSFKKVLKLINEQNEAMDKRIALDRIRKMPFFKPTIKKG